MVPASGSKSNTNFNLLAEWANNDKAIPKEIEDFPYPNDIEELFNTLGQWNTYLEQHVPYFSERRYAEDEPPQTTPQDTLEHD